MGVNETDATAVQTSGFNRVPHFGQAIANLRKLVAPSTAKTDGLTLGARDRSKAGIFSPPALLRRQMTDRQVVL